MHWTSLISKMTLSLLVLVIACSSDDDGQDELLATYRGHLKSADSTVSDRWDSKTNDEQYRAEMNEHLNGMATVREDMQNECNRIDNCPNGGGVANYGSNGHVDNDQMLTSDEMDGLQRGEESMHSEMNDFDTHCRDADDASVSTCESYRDTHLDNMSTMLDYHDDMCGQMMEGMGGGCNCQGVWDGDDDYYNNYM